MKTRSAVFLSVVALAAAQSAAADNDRGFNRLGANLVGYEETPSTLSTTGNGRFDALIRNDDSEIVYRLSYNGLEGDVQQAHIHLGQRALSGGIVVFLCTNLGNGPAGLQGSQPCPPAPATITGTITDVDVTPNAAAVGQGSVTRSGEAAAGATATTDLPPPPRCQRGAFFESAHGALDGPGATDEMD